MLKHLLTLATTVALGFSTTFAQETVKFADVADCWVRSNNVTWKDGNSFKIEFHKVSDADAFYGLLSFEYELPVGMRVQSSTLHFVTERVRSHNTSIRGFVGTVADNDTYNNLESSILKTLESEPIYTGQLAGEWNMAIGDTYTETGESKLKQENQNVEAWSNEVDVTDYVRGISGNRVNFMLTCDSETGQNCVFSKETQITNLPPFIENVEDVHPYLEVVFEEDPDVGSVTVGVTADTYVRKDGDDKNMDSKYLTSGELEIRNRADGGVMYALFEFALPEEAIDSKKYEVTLATLRLVCTQNKGSRGMALYAYGNSIDGNTTYRTEASAVEEALSGSPVATFDAMGCGNRNMTESHESVANFSTVDKWTSNIDITDFIKGLNAARAVTSGNVTLMLAKAGQHNDSMKFASSEVADKTNATHNFTILAADMVPQLTVNYTKKKTTTGIEDVAVSDENAPVEYYNINGMRVNGDNLTPGIYIKRQGAATTKIYVK